MSTWQSRLIEEKDTLQIKLLALIEYLQTDPDLDVIGEVQLALLKVQLSAMTTYRDILTQRIQALR